MPLMSTDICDLSLKAHVESCYLWAAKAEGSRVGVGKGSKDWEEEGCSEKSLEMQMEIEGCWLYLRQICFWTSLLGGRL